MSETPRWMRDLRRFLPLRNQFLLSGNVRDRYPTRVEGSAPLLLRSVEYLTCELARAGLSRVIAFDSVSGFFLPPSLERDNSDDSAFFSSLGVKFDDTSRAAVSLERFFESLAPLVSESPESVVVIADFASQLVQRPDHLVDNEYRGFTRAVVLSHQSEPRSHPQIGNAGFNPIN